MYNISNQTTLYFEDQPQRKEILMTFIQTLDKMEYHQDDSSGNNRTVPMETYINREKRPSETKKKKEITTGTHPEKKNKKEGLTEILKREITTGTLEH